MKITPRLLRVFLIGPLNIMGAIPAILFWLAGDWRAWGLEGLVPALVRIPAGLAALAGGGWLVARTVPLFTDLGKGTPAPWDPPQNLVVAGPYRYTRNPMVCGVCGVLLGEALLLASWAVFAWALLFLLANLILVPLWEEPELARRFGEEFQIYRRHVPRWWPRPRPWEPPKEQTRQTRTPGGPDSRPLTH